MKKLIIIIYIEYYGGWACKFKTSVIDCFWQEEW